MPQVIPLAAAAVGAALTSATAGILGATAFTIFGTAITVGQIVGAIVTVLGAVLGSLLAPSQKPPRGSRERQQSIREGAGPRAMGCGTLKIGADAHPIYDSNDDNEFVRLLAVNHGPIEAFTTHYLNSEEVTLDASGWVTAPSKWAGSVQIVTTLGATDQAAMAEVVSAYSPWTSEHRAQGVALVFIKQKALALSDPNARHLHQELIWNGIIQAANDVYDPRDGSTGWTDNATLCLLWYVTHADGRNLSLDQIDLTSWEASADVDDELVTLKDGGTEKRYRCNAQIGLDEDPNDVIARMLENMDASLYFTSEGKLAIRKGNEAESDDLTFTANHILSTDFQAGPRAIDRYNRVLPKIISEDHNYQEITVPAYEDATSVAASGAKTFDYPLLYCPGHTQAQRLAKKKFLRLNPEEVGTVVTNLAGFFAKPGSTIKLDYPTAETDLPLRVYTRERESDGLSVRLEVQSIHPDYDEWDETTEEQDVAALPTLVGTSSLLSDPTGVAATPSSIDVTQTNKAAGIQVTWTPPSLVGVQAEVMVSVANQDEWTDREMVDAAIGAARVGPLDDGVTYDARVRFVGPGGGGSDWVIVEDITARAVEASLTAPTISGPLANPQESAQYSIDITTADVDNLWRTKLYKSTTNDFGTASVVFTSYAARDSDTVFNTTDSQGTYYYWGVSENVSGVEGPESTVETVTVDSGGA